MKRLKLTPEGVDSIIEIILSDESLLDYVLNLVNKRLTSETRTDTAWCNQVIDLSIEQVLREVNVNELINSISKTYVHAAVNRNSSRNPRASSAEPELLKPQFSNTEPHAASIVSPRRMVKELNKNKLPNQELSPVHSSNRALPKRAPIPDKYDRTTSVESNASTIPVGEAPHAGVIISMNQGARESDDWQDGAFRNARSESSMSSGDDADLYVSGVASDVHGSFRDDSPEDKDALESRRWIDMVQEREPIDSISDADSLEETPRETYDGPKRSDLSQKLGSQPIAKSSNLKSSSASPSSKEPDSSRTNETSTVPAESGVTDDDFLNSWEKQVLRGMKTGDESGAEEDTAPAAKANAKLNAVQRSRSSSGESVEISAETRSRSNSETSTQTASTASTTNAADKHHDHEQKATHEKAARGTGSDAGEEEYSSDEHASESGEENLVENYFHTSAVASTGQLLFFDQSRFDADADYFGAAAAQGKKGGEKSPTKISPSGKKTSKKTRVKDPNQHVRFAPTLISEVRYRDRVGYHEKGELFFTHNEEYQFTLDQSKEAERAEAVGMSWMEWMDQRTDEDVQREEQEEANSLGDFKLYSGEYYEEDENVDAGHDFKAAATHAPAVVHAVPHHADSAHAAMTVHPHKAAPSGGGAAPEVFNDELSVPSCSDDDDEYDFDDF